VLLEYIRGQEALMASIIAAAKSGKDVAELIKEVRVTPRSIQMTITMVVVIPIFLVYPMVQKYFMKALLLGAIKG
jgi:ABC-type glycerol-3-phosphate transport system permease component